MKLACLLLTISAVAIAQQPPPPDCSVAANAAIMGGVGDVPVSPPAATAYYDNRGTDCTFWAVSYRADSGLSGYTVKFESATGSLTPGTFGAFSGNTIAASSSFGSASAGSAIYSSVSASATTVDVPWIRVDASGATGTGNIYVTVQGWRSNWTLAGGGGSGSSACPNPCPVVGTAAAGSPPSGDPVQVGGTDGTDIRAVSTDSSGNVNVNVKSGGGCTGSVATPCQIGVDNGGTSMPAIGDSSGRMVTVGAGTAGTPAGGVQSIQGVSSMTPVQTSPTTSANAAGNPFFNELSDGANTNTIKAASTQSVSTDKSFVVQVNPNNPAIPAAGQGATGLAVPSGAGYLGCQAETAYPTAATAGNLTGVMCDKAGRPAVVLNTVRNLVGTFSIQSTSATASTMIAAGSTGVFNDIISLTCTTETPATATIISISDNGTGGTIYKFNVGGVGGSPGFSIPYTSPLPQGTSAAAWEILNSGAVTIDCNGTYAKNQ